MSDHHQPTHDHGITARVELIDWDQAADDLNASGWALLPGLLSHDECDALKTLYPQNERFRKHVIMARHGYGQGEYKYFEHPLPAMITELRGALYPHLAPIANHWNDLMKIDIRFPADHQAFLERCHAAGQTRPTPLMLQYGPDDYNCLHQDLYGEHVFPMQAVFLLSQPSEDFTGGEFVLTEQRPRMQSRAEVVPLQKGDCAVFTVNHRPRKGARGYHRVNLRHGVSKLRSGHRLTAGIIFHDAAA